MLKELRARLRAERPKISREIETAREHGDLKENAEYHAAKERQGMVEAQLKDTEDKLSRAEVIDPAALSGERVKFGATVTLLNLDTDEETVLQIVGGDQADVEKGMLSISSPLARGLISKEAGDETVIRLPGGKRSYEIVDVEFK